MGKKNKRKTKNKAKASKSSTSSSIPSPSSSPVAAKRPISRRKMLGLLLGVPLVGVAGVGVHRHDVKKRALHDLSVLGNGSPAIVQIHDPGCRLCRRLMANTKKALGDRDDITYRIADITKTKGRQFQERYGVPHVTLLLFNAKGRHVHTVQWVTPAEELAEHFRRHLPRVGT